MQQAGNQEQCNEQEVIWESGLDDDAAPFGEDHFRENHEPFGKASYVTFEEVAGVHSETAGTQHEAPFCEDSSGHSSQHGESPFGGIQETFDDIQEQFEEEENDPIFSGDDQRYTLLEVMNTTSLKPNSKALATRKASILAIAEHSVGPGTAKEATRTFEENGWALELGPTIPARRNNTGGVAMAVKQPGKLIKHMPNTVELQAAEALGRVAVFLTDIGNFNTIAIAVVYGETNGNHNQEAADTTCALVDAILCELETMPEIPTAIVGDLNAEHGKLEVLEQLRITGWVDTGAVASRWGGRDNEPTCITANAKAM